MLKRFATGLNRRVTTVWPVRTARSRLAEPIVSISFDDFPRSAWTQGGLSLDRYGFRATYYVSGAFCLSKDGARSAVPAGRIDGVGYCLPTDIVAAHAAGHEIGCHSFEHRRVPQISNSELELSIARNAEFLASLISVQAPASFAYPQGAVDVRTKCLLGKRFLTCRGTYPGLNAGWIDLSLLRAVALSRTFAIDAAVERLVAETKKRKAWLIFFGHDIGPDASLWGCSAEVFEELLAYLSHERLTVLPIGEGARRVMGS